MAKAKKKAAKKAAKKKGTKKTAAKKGGKKGGKKADGAPDGGQTAPSKVKGVDGKTLKSLTLVTGPNTFNSHCFACQYFVQRLLGALLGPYYSPKNAGPALPKGYAQPPVPEHTAEPLSQHKQYVVSEGTFESLDRGEESRKKYESKYPFSPVPHYGMGYPFALAEQAAETTPAEEVAAIEIFSLVKENFPEPSEEEALEQYSKWENFLAAHHRLDFPVSLVEVSSEADKKKKGKGKPAKGGKGKVKGKAKVAPSSKSIKGKFGKYFGRFQDHAVQAYFTDICNRRVPTEWKPVCQKLFDNLKAVTEELAVGDRPDEVCMRVKICPAKSYLAKRAHSATRGSD